MIRRECVPIFWNENRIKNYDKLEMLLSTGYEVERVDELNNNYFTTLVYILKKETNDD